MTKLNIIHQIGSSEIECLRAEAMPEPLRELISEIELFGAPKLITHRGYMTAAMVPVVSPRCLEMLVNRADTCNRCLAYQPEPYIVRHNFI